MNYPKSTRKNAIPGILRELHFRAIFNFKIAFLQFSCIMGNRKRRCCVWLYPEHRAEAKQDLQLLNAQKMGEHEAEIEKIKNVFLAILRDIKKDMDNREQPGEAVTAAMFQTMQETMKDHQQELLSMDDVTAMIAGQIGKFLPMDGETAEQFRQLAKRMMEQVGK